MIHRPPECDPLTEDDFISTKKQNIFNIIAISVGLLFYGWVALHGTCNMVLMQLWSNGRKQDILMWFFYASAQIVIVGRLWQYTIILVHDEWNQQQPLTELSTKSVTQIEDFVDLQFICSYLKFVVGLIEWVQLRDLKFKLKIFFNEETTDDLKVYVKRSGIIAFVICICTLFILPYLLIITGQFFRKIPQLPLQNKQFWEFYIALIGEEGVETMLAQMCTYVVSISDQFIQILQQYAYMQGTIFTVLSIMILVILIQITKILSDPKSKEALGSDLNNKKASMITYVIVSVLSYFFFGMFLYGFGFFRSLIPSIYTRQVLFVILNPFFDLINIAFIYYLHSKSLWESRKEDKLLSGIKAEKHERQKSLKNQASGTLIQDPIEDLMESQSNPDLMSREDLDGDTDQIFRPRQSTYRRNNNFFDLHDDDVFFREANSSRYLSGGQNYDYDAYPEAMDNNANEHGYGNFCYD